MQDQRVLVQTDSGVLDDTPEIVTVAFSQSPEEEQTVTGTAISSTSQNIDEVLYHTEKETMEFTLEGGEIETHSITNMHTFRNPHTVFVHGSSDDIMNIVGEYNKELYTNDDVERFRIGETEFTLALGMDWKILEVESRDSFHVAETGSKLSEMLCDYSEVLVIKSDVEITSVQRV